MDEQKLDGLICLFLHKERESLISLIGTVLTALWLFLKGLFSFKEFFRNVLLYLDGSDYRIFVSSVSLNVIYAKSVDLNYQTKCMFLH